MENIVTWKNVKNSITSISEDEKREIEVMAEIMGMIVEKRESLKLSQKDLEKLTGIKQGSICRIETMKVRPQLDTLLKIMIPLGLTLGVKPVNNERIAHQ